MNAGEQSRKAMLDEATAREADNAAAAQEDAMKGKPPVIPLGQEGAANVYYSIPHKTKYTLKANEHARMHLYRMAALADYARWLAPDLSPDAVEKEEGAIMRRAGRLLMELTGGKRYNPDMLRGRGVWRDADGGIRLQCGGCLLSGAA